MFPIHFRSIIKSINRFLLFNVFHTVLGPCVRKFPTHMLSILWVLYPYAEHMLTNCMFMLIIHVRIVCVCSAYAYKSSSLGTFKCPHILNFYIFLNSENPWWNSEWEEGESELAVPFNIWQEANLQPDSYLIIQMSSFCGWWTSPHAICWMTLNMPYLGGLTENRHTIPQ